MPTRKLEMPEYEFTLKYRLPDVTADPAVYVDLLAERCSDALIGTGKPGRIALEFMREAPSAYAAILSAMEDVRSAVPGARLVEAAPDYVGISEIAAFLGCTRQNVRKYTITDASFPMAVHEGTSELFHLRDVFDWAVRRNRKTVDATAFDVAKVTMKVNFAKEAARIPAIPPELLHAAASEHR
jgi:hypothetical protein